MPFLPFFMASHVSAAELPSGVTAPSPVTTTRLFSFMCLPPLTYIASPPSTLRTAPVTYCASAR